MLRSRRKMRQKEELFQQEIVNSTTIIFLIKTDQNISEINHLERSN
jgi:hypothetical protein